MITTWPSAGARLQTGPLVAQQAARAGARDVPVAPVVALELSETIEQPFGHGATRAAVDSRQRVEQDRHGVGAERGGIPAVERAFGGRTREVGTHDEGIGIDEVQATEHREPLDQRPEGERSEEHTSELQSQSNL